MSVVANMCQYSFRVGKKWRMAIPIFTHFRQGWAKMVKRNGQRCVKNGESYFTTLVTWWRHDGNAKKQVYVPHPNPRIVRIIPSPAANEELAVATSFGRRDSLSHISW